MLAVSRSACRPTGSRSRPARPLSPGQWTCDAHGDTSTVTVVCTTPSLVTDRRPTTCGTLALPTLDRANTRLRPAWTPELHDLLGSAIAETVIADPIWP